ncbi:hypothetical protein N7541_009725 [Penicillium brevicompactum]|uniref:Uncharacterized protein n=1 Tax=Penicillium brevicompactum TaxID=5074 RepID=A0A9W9QMC0_PENBR|nr:hypothetical protein N7541_009725 [Penicillium brevicompactum]
METMTPSGVADLAYSGSFGLTLSPRAPLFNGMCTWDLHSPSLNSDNITENKDVKKWVDSYLGVGEWVMDQSVAVMGSSAWFERRR